jgi:hypothetical protein
VGAEPESGVGVAPLMIIAPPELTDTTCPLMVAAAPGVRVSDPIMNAEEPSWLTVWPPTRTGGTEVVDPTAAGPVPVS